MPDIVIVGVEGLKETKMTVPHEVIRQGVNVIRPVPFKARWWDNDTDPNPTDPMPYETITCYDTGVVLAGRIVMAPREWIADHRSLTKPDSPAPSKVVDLDTELRDEEFELDDEDEESAVSFGEWFFGMKGRHEEEVGGFITKELLSDLLQKGHNPPKSFIDPNIS